MKKQLLLIVALFITTAMSAQFYAGLKFGYGFGTQKSDFGNTITDNSKTVEWATLGQGLTPGLKLGYFFGDNFGVELGINYMIGAEQTVLDYQQTKDLNNGKAGINALATASSNQLRLMPQLVYRWDNGFYGRFGLVIPIAGKTTITGEQTVDLAPLQPAKTENYEIELTGKFNMGFAGAFGYSFELSDNLGLFGEVEYVGLNIRGNTSEYTKYEVDGKDQLANMDVYDKNTNFVDELNSSSNNPAYNSNVDKTQPKDDLRSTSGYSSVRINIGITFSF
jgi:opacity protein-like surface antigen